MRKVVSREDAIRAAQTARRAGRRVVTTNGVFDLLHVGHIRALAFARAQGDLLIVGINSDASVRRNKGPSRPIMPARERAEMLAALTSVDYVFVFSEKTPEKWLYAMRPAVHMKSSEYSRAQVIGLQEVESQGGKVKLFPHTGKHSTSAIIEKIRKIKK